VVDEGAVARSGVDVVTTLLTRVVRHGVAVLHRLPRRDGGRGVGAHLVAGGGGLVLQAIDVHPQVSVSGLVGERDRNALALVRADHQWLDRVVAQPDRDLPALLLGSDRGDGAGEGVHVTARVVVTEAVRGDVDVDRTHVVGAVNGAAGQAAGGCCRRRRGCRRTAESGGRRRQRSPGRDRDEASWGNRAETSWKATTQDEDGENGHENRGRVRQSAQRRLRDAVQPGVQPGTRSDGERDDRRLHDDVVTRGALPTGTGEMGGQRECDQGEHRRASQQPQELVGGPGPVSGVRTRLEDEEQHRAGQGAQKCDPEVTQHDQGVVGFRSPTGGRDP
jgi:hypothetical protein